MFNLLAAWLSYAPTYGVQSSVNLLHCFIYNSVLATVPTRPVFEMVISTSATLTASLVSALNSGGQGMAMAIFPHILNDGMKN